jgi:prepilin-type N-terminal cleavage/methylation domain-containing protein
MRSPTRGETASPGPADDERMSSTAAERPNATDEDGFTLIELLYVLVIIGVLLAIAVPSFIGFKDRAQQRTAASNVREAVPDAEAYYNDNSTYAGMTLASLQSFDHVDPGLAVFADATHYCLSDSDGTHIAKVVGPGGSVDDSAAGPCTSATG